MIAWPPSRSRSKPKPTPIAVPFSSSYLVLDAQGAVLAELASVEDAIACGRSRPGAIAVVGSPSGVVLLRVARDGATASEGACLRAARRWLQRVPAGAA